MEPIIIPLQIYPVDVMVWWGDEKELIKTLKKYHIPKQEIPQDFHIGAAHAVMFRGGQILIYLKTKPASISELATLNHEIFHVCLMVMKRVGVSLTKSSEEAFAYLVGYLTEKIYERLPILFSEAS